MKQLSALGLHTYAGGMHIGASKVFDCPGSVEPWERAHRLRELAGLPTLREVPSGSFDVVFANPPCSRFSMMSRNAFSREDREEFGRFCEITELIALAKEVSARAAWWETGPMAAGEGLPLIEGGRRELEREWGCEVTALVVRCDVKDLGVPQLRPRTHVAWVRGRKEFPGWARHREAEPTQALAWLDSRELPEGLACGPSEEDMVERWGARTALDYAVISSEVSTFQSTKPKCITPRCMHTPAVVSGRPMARTDEDRWLRVQEVAELMSYPRHAAEQLAVELGWREALVLLAKNVSALAAERVGRLVEAAVLSPDLPGAPLVAVDDAVAPRGGPEGAKTAP